MDRLLAKRNKDLFCLNDGSFPEVSTEERTERVTDFLEKYFPIKGGFFGNTTGYVKAVDGVTFNIKRGTTMGLVGESGCG
ncbi:MAG: hypothetical protein ABS909_10095, partial [Arthrobacter sp.]